MERDEIRDVILETMERSLHAQLRAIRGLRRREPEARSKKRLSHVDMVYDVLKRAAAPLHVSEIISRVSAVFGVQLNRESIVSSLSKKVAAGDRFARTDKNTFALREEK